MKTKVADNALPSASSGQAWSFWRYQALFQMSQSFPVLGHQSYARRAPTNDQMDVPRSPNDVITWKIL